MWFIKNNIYKGEVVSLREKYRTSEKTSYDGVPTVYYDILVNENNKKIGTIELRLTVDGDMYYYGHIGYNILNDYRGHHFAYYACKVLFEIARSEFKMKELIITCSPENIASYKTLKKLNGELIEIVEVPKDHDLYRLGETSKCIFRFKIDLKNCI
jgi:predicted acetyltransferase